MILWRSNSNANLSVTQRPRCAQNWNWSEPTYGPYNILLPARPVRDFAVNTTSWVHFFDAWRSGEVYVGVLDWSVAWSWIWVPLGLGLLAVRLILMAFGAAEELTITHSESH